MSKRRANNEGGLSQRPNGTWEARLTWVDPDTGARRRLAFYGRTAKAAAQKMKDARRRLESGGPPRDSTRTVADWFAHWRETTLAASDRKQTTKALYGALARKHLEPEPFGATPLDRLRPTHVEGVVLALREKELSDSTVRQVYAVRRRALDGAVRVGLLARNPAAQVRRPGVKRQEARHLVAADVAALLRAAEGSRYHAALALIALTGIRRGEAAALRWDAVDLDAGVLRVRSTVSRVEGELVTSEPKTDRSRRTVPLPPQAVAMLRRHRTAQREERLRAGDQWRETGMVFTTEGGTAVDPRNLLRVLEAAARKAKVGDVGVHTLRHSAAVSWLENGIHIKAVADLLGHSSVAITGDVYGHTSDDTARAAVDGLAGRLGL